jgi:pyridoxamine 5'-phosphate oxidase
MASTPDPDELAALRREYGDSGLDGPDLAADPVAMFRHWMHDTVVAGLHEPNAMVLATVSADGHPSSRMVLLKGVDDRGFVFYSNYDSRKGNELAANPRAALLFPWHDLQRQVRVEGRAEQLSREESAAYFVTRPRASQLGAWASPQSTEVTSRDDLERRYAEVEDRFHDSDVPLPEHWGGYLVVPEVVEFWQGRRGRMHDRLVYRRAAGAPSGEAAWEISRLAP